MNFETFLQNFLEKPDTIKQYLKQHPVVHFTAQNYPLLFFSLLKRVVQQKTTIQCKSADLQAVDLGQLKAEMATPFLGGNLLYWCGNTNSLGAKVIEQFLEFAQTYHGPHNLWFFSAPPSKQKISRTCTVVLPTEISQKMKDQLHKLLFPKQKNKAVPDALYKQVNKPSLETTCLLMHYASVLGRQHVETFAKEWLATIVAPEKSLFSLSTYFFAKHAKNFFALWHDVQAEYPTQFWIAYWSEQLFRATCFVQAAQKNNFLEAKKIAFRLPFTLIKQDWKRLRVEKLIAAHNVLYEIDYRLKNGGSAFALDLFYTRWFDE